MAEKSFLGLDLGTNSVGWCVTDEDFKIKKINGKDAWGVRLFEQAETAKARRAFRNTKRRRNRMKSRLYHLNQLFCDEIAKIDPDFFIRMSESTYVLEDKTNANYKHVWFKEKEKEKQFYKDYPTIYHLRSALIHNEKSAFDDVRKIYIAIHHIMKYRGNFLSDNDIDIKSAKLDDTFYTTINSYLNELDDEENSLTISQANIEEIINVLSDDELDKKIKLKKSKDIFGIGNKTSSLKEEKILFFLKMCNGSTENEIGIDNKYDDNYAKYSETLGDDIVLLDCAKKIYDLVWLKKLLGSKQWLSDAYSNIYDEHEKQLKELKSIIRQIDLNKGDDGAVYNAVFNPIDDTTPDALKLKKDKYGKEMERNYYQFINTNKEDINKLNKYIMRILSDNKQYVSEDKLPIVDKYIKLCEQNKFLIKISNESNSTIPHQLHFNELDKILDNGQKHFKFINEEFKSKIKEIFKFRVPYDFGPFNSEHSTIGTEGTASFIKKKKGKEEERITFENYKDIIDVEETRKEFINSKLNACKYLYAHTVLPKHSLYYVKYDLYNKINAIKINGNYLSSTERKKCFDLICEKGSLTYKQLLNELNKTLKDPYDVKSVSKLDAKEKAIKFDATPYKQFIDIYGGIDKVEGNKKDIEDIIKLLVIYKDKKSIAIEIIKKNYKYLKEEQLDKIKKLNLQGYGSYSKEFLVNLKAKNGKSILEILEEEPKELNQILYDANLGLQDKIKEYNSNDENGEDTSSTKDKVTQILNSISSTMRRPIIQSLKIIKELVYFNRKPLDVISIEVTREDLSSKDKKKAEKDSRYEQLEKFLKSIKADEDKAIKEQIGIVQTELGQYKDNKTKLNGRALFLYFKQLGYDLYTGKKMDINDVLSGVYDIDHIYPKSKLYDDSLDNTVLVSKEYNQQIKRDQYPLPKEIREKQKQLWEFLRKKDAMSQEKYNRLIRPNELTEEEKQNFINAQLNSVNVANLRLRDILNVIYPETKIILSKAQYPSKIRQKYELFKIRDLNDCHHAFDAYLNIIAGYSLYKEYTRPLELSGGTHRVHISKNSGSDKTYNYVKFLENTVTNLNLEPLLNEYYVKTNMLHTYQLDYGGGAFYTQKILKRGSQEKLMPIHTNQQNKLSDSTKYGGYNKEKIKFYVIGTNKKGKKQLVPVSELDSSQKYNDTDINCGLKKYLEEKHVGLTININQKIYNKAKILVNQGEYLLTTYGRDTRSPIIPFFSNSISKRMMTTLHYLMRIDEKYESKFIENAVSNHNGDLIVQINKDNEKKYISKGDCYQLFNALCVDNIHDSRFKLYKPVVDTLKKIFQGEKEEQFKNKSYAQIKKQMDKIIHLINRGSYTENNARTAHSTILNEATFVEESTTGLISKKIDI